MSFFDEDKPKKPATHELGSDLTFLSADELQARITLLKYEIERLQAEVERKNSGRQAAENMFRSKM
ncbi:DUF1192 domain-containing protein [Rhizobium sp. RU36D]|uniref:DUF1192 domain-containing protein n=1 Tax=Rhizobium sp. RU36D TaxID=1907415 RepID=UPI0009D8D14C|nr:DUF1192 domain-containing protein [Rhizobium sp. RU36D]SMC41662.1 Uncharacterized small protein, DUF1192 family [Rhizobium sp. RU36D]